MLSSRTSDEEGTPEAPSFFLDDVRFLLSGAPHLRARSLGEVTWTPEEAPTAAEWDRALAARGPRREERLPGPSPRRRCSPTWPSAARSPPSWLERFADCPVKWLVESVLRPEALEPDPEQMVRGQLRPRGARAHLLQALRRRDRRPARDGVEPRRRRADPARGAATPSASDSASPRARRACGPPLRRLEFDLLATSRPRPSATAPSSRTVLELRFGEGEEGARSGGDRRGRARQRADRPGGHLERDGAGDRLQERARRWTPTRSARWETENRFQAALYMLAVEQLLGKRAVGGVYVALGAEDPRPRGMLADGVSTSSASGSWPATACRRRSSRRSSTGRASGSARPRPRSAAASCAARRTRAPGTAAAHTRRSAGAT